MPKIPGVNHKRAIQAFEKAGFHIAREGKHTSMTDGRRFLVIPRHNPINAYTLGGIAKDAGLTVEEFKKLL
jgi:predicted RNA binding protein YcfA (HicA-like mRNA interferase family)